MRRRRFLLSSVTLAVAGGCRPAPAPAEPAAVRVPAGPFLRGSDRAERDAAYRLDEAAYGHDVTRRRRWYENEPPLRPLDLPAFRIMRTPVTNALYAEFVRDTGHRLPAVDPRTWAGYRLVHPYERTLRHQWRDDRPPPGREAHPVVLVDHSDATAFARWLSRRTGRSWRLPREEEWEKAARGTDGRMFPWGNAFDCRRLDSADCGPFDTVAVGSYPEGASPFGLLDAAGLVFEWTSTPDGPGRYIVKGGSWDDRGCGVCRPAARHGRPADIRHILIGFRLVGEEEAT